MRKYIFLLSFLVYLTVAKSAPACEDCLRVKDTEATLAQSDLVVFGRKTAEGPSSGKSGGPDWITITVEQVFKGKIFERDLQVNSWDGSCADGITSEDNEPFIVFLRSRHDPYDPDPYTAVPCGVKSLPVVNDMVEFDRKRLSVNEFAAWVNQISGVEDPQKYNRAPQEDEEGEGEDENSDQSDQIDYQGILKSLKGN